MRDGLYVAESTAHDGPSSLLATCPTRQRPHRTLASLVKHHGAAWPREASGLGEGIVEVRPSRFASHGGGGEEREGHRTRSPTKDDRTHVRARRRPLYDPSCGRHPGLHWKARRAVERHDDGPRTVCAQQG